MKLFKYKKFEVMSRPEKAVYFCLLAVGISLVSVFGVWWFEPSHVPHNFTGVLHLLDIAAFLLLTYVVWYQIVYELFSWYLSGFMKRPEVPFPPRPGRFKVALLTAFVPSKEPYDVLENTVKAMVAVDYLHDTWVLDEGNDNRVKKICESYGAKHYSRKGIAEYNTVEGKYKAKTKAGNYNSWFNQHAADYDLVGQHDVDFVPRKDFFIKTLGYFEDSECAFVGSPQIYGNKDESWIARGAAEQAYGFYGHMQKGLYGQDMQLFIGANHIVRVAAHDDIGGYSGHIVEDHLTGMKFYARHWKSVYVPEVLAVGEAPATWDSYFKQQMRWAFGLMDILFRHSPPLFKKMKAKHTVNYFLLQQYYFFGLAQFIGIVLITLYFVFGFQSTAMNLPMLLTLYVPLLFWQLVIFFWLQRFNIIPQEEKGLLWRGRLLTLAAWPIYLVAFFRVTAKRKLTYAVTPKGKSQEYQTNYSLFIPHFILATITTVGIIMAILTKNTAPQILFWAILNTLIMGYFSLAFLFTNWILKPQLAWKSDNILDKYQV